MGHALNNSIQDCLIRTSRMRGRRDEVDPRHRPRRDRHPDPGRAGAGARGHEPRGARPRGVRRARLGVARASTAARSSSSSSAWARRCDYEDERFTLDEGYARAVLDGVRRALREGLHLPRPLHGQLGPGDALGDLRPRGRGPRGHRHALLHRLPAGVRDRARSRSRRCAPRRCSPTPRSPCIPTTTATARLVGEKAILPLVGRKLKIIADEYVKPEFGTGALKITPGHDPNDFDIGQRHGLPQISVIGEDGRMTEPAPERFVGMTVAGGREAVVAELREQGLIARTEEYLHDGAVLAPLRRADRAADLAAVVHADGRARRARRSTSSRSGQVRIMARELQARLPRLDGEHPPVVHLAPAVVGPPDPGLVPRRRDATSGPSRPRARAGSATPTCSTRGSAPALLPFATLGWPEDTPSCAGLLSRPTCSSPRATSSSCGSRG